MAMINEHNMDEWFFNYHEDMLTAEDKANVEQFVNSHPEYSGHFNAWGNSFISDEVLVFEKEKDLLITDKNYKKYALLALVFITGASLAFFGYKEYKGIENSEYGVYSPDKNDSNIISLFDAQDRDQELDNLIASIQPNENVESNQHAQSVKSQIQYEVYTIANETQTELSFRESSIRDVINLKSRKEILDMIDVDIDIHSIEDSVERRASEVFEVKNVSLPSIKLNNNNQQQFGVAGVNPLDFSPSFAGSGNILRVESNWSNGKINYPEFELDNPIHVGRKFTSVDAYIGKLKSGFGIQYQENNFGSGSQWLFDDNIVGYNITSVAFSPKIEVAKAFFIEPSFMIRFHDFNFKNQGNQYNYEDVLDNMTFTGNIDPVDWNARFNTFSTGIQINHKSITGGFSIHNIYAKEMIISNSYDPNMIISTKLNQSIQYNYNIGTGFKSKSNDEFIGNMMLYGTSNQFISENWLVGGVQWNFLNVLGGFSDKEGYTGSVSLEIPYSYKNNRKNKRGGVKLSYTLSSSRDYFNYNKHLCSEIGLRITK